MEHVLEFCYLNQQQRQRFQRIRALQSILEVDSDGKMRMPFRQGWDRRRKSKLTKLTAKS